jgi:hypothetical protein
MNETGPPVVVNCTVCVVFVGGFGTNVNDAGLRVSVGRGFVTTSLTWVMPDVPAGTATAGAKITDAV